MITIISVSIVSLIIYFLLANFAYGFCKVKLEGRSMASFDSKLMAVFWPMSLAIYLCYFIFRYPCALSINMGKRVATFSQDLFEKRALKQSKEAEQKKKRQEWEKKNQLIISKDHLTSKQYKHIKPLVIKYEETLPVSERE